VLWTQHAVLKRSSAWNINCYWINLAPLLVILVFVLSTYSFVVRKQKVTLRGQLIIKPRCMVASVTLRPTTMMQLKCVGTAWNLTLCLLLFLFMLLAYLVGKVYNPTKTFRFAKRPFFCQEEFFSVYLWFLDRCPDVNPPAQCWNSWLQVVIFVGCRATKRRVVYFDRSTSDGRGTRLARRRWRRECRATNAQSLLYTRTAETVSQSAPGFFSWKLWLFKWNSVSFLGVCFCLKPEQLRHTRFRGLHYYGLGPSSKRQFNI